MNYKNRKADYPLYPTVAFADMRDMLKLTADRYEDRPAISYRKTPHDADAIRLSFRRVFEEVASLATALMILVSLFFTGHSSGYSAGISALLHTAFILFSVMGSFLGLPKEGKRKS